MSSNDPRGIIELGNINIKCLIFRINTSGAAEILSTAVTRSEGIHNGVIVNIAKASEVIRSCISDAEKKAKISLKKIEENEYKYPANKVKGSSKKYNK